MERRSAINQFSLNHRPRSAVNVREISLQPIPSENYSNGRIVMLSSLRICQAMDNSSRHHEKV